MDSVDSEGPVAGISIAVQNICLSLCAVYFVLGGSFSFLFFLADGSVWSVQCSMFYRA